MAGRKPYPEPTMTLKEIRELLLLRDWSRDDLAEKLGLCRNTVDRWFCVNPAQRRVPGVAECLVMATWLAESRTETRSPVPVGGS